MPPKLIPDQSQNLGYRSFVLPTSAPLPAKYQIIRSHHIRINLAEDAATKAKLIYDLIDVLERNLGLGNSTGHHWAESINLAYKLGPQKKNYLLGDLKIILKLYADIQKIYPNYANDPLFKNLLQRQTIIQSIEESYAKEEHQLVNLRHEHEGSTSAKLISERLDVLEAPGYLHAFLNQEGWRTHLHGGVWARAQTGTFTDEADLDYVIQYPCDPNKTAQENLNDCGNILRRQLNCASTATAGKPDTLSFELPMPIDADFGPEAKENLRVMKIQIKVCLDDASTDAALAGYLTRNRAYSISKQKGNGQFHNIFDLAQILKSDRYAAQHKLAVPAYPESMDLEQFVRMIAKDGQQEQCIIEGNDADAIIKRLLKNPQPVSEAMWTQLGFLLRLDARTNTKLFHDYHIFNLIFPKTKIKEVFSEAVDGPAITWLTEYLAAAQQNILQKRDSGDKRIRMLKALIEGLSVCVALADGQKSPEEMALLPKLIEQQVLPSFLRPLAFMFGHSMMDMQVYTQSINWQAHIQSYQYFQTAYQMSKEGNEKLQKICRGLLDDDAAQTQQLLTELAQLPPLAYREHATLELLQKLFKDPKSWQAPFEKSLAVTLNTKFPDLIINEGIEFTPGEDKVNPHQVNAQLKRVRIGHWQEGIVNQVKLLQTCDWVIRKILDDIKNPRSHLHKGTPEQISHRQDRVMRDDLYVLTIQSITPQTKRELDAVLANPHHRKRLPILIDKLQKYTANLCVGTWQLGIGKTAANNSTSTAMMQQQLQTASAGAIPSAAAPVSASSISPMVKAPAAPPSLAQNLLAAADSAIGEAKQAKVQSDTALQAAAAEKVVSIPKKSELRVSGPALPANSMWLQKPSLMSQQPIASAVAPAGKTLSG